VLVATLVAYKVVSGIPWRGFLPTPGRLRALALNPPTPPQ
jgi:hypothetical protein